MTLGGLASFVPHSGDSNFPRDAFWSFYLHLYQQCTVLVDTRRCMQNFEGPYSEAAPT